VAQATLTHTGAGTYTGGTAYNGAAGSTGGPGSMSPAWKATWAMQPLPDTASRIVQMVAKLSGAVEPEGPDRDADIHWNPGNGWRDDDVGLWPQDFPLPAQSQLSAAALTTGLPTVAQWNSAGEVGLSAADTSGRADRDGGWSAPTCVIDYQLARRRGGFQILGLLPPLLLGPIATLLPRDWFAVRALLARGAGGRGQHRFTAEEWAAIRRSALEWRAPRRFVLG
jgi:hypothetical protein